jgi:DNA excision repair protein ERCC-4
VTLKFQDEGSGQRRAQIALGKKPGLVDMFLNPKYFSWVIPPAPVGFQLVIDTREQDPLTWPGYIPQVRACLQKGDYSYRGGEHKHVVERKSLADWWMCLGRERDRFERELVALEGYERAFLLIEAPGSWLTLAGQYSRSRVPGSTSFNSACSWVMLYRTIPLFVPRECASRVVLYLLETGFRMGKERESSYNMDKAKPNV